jgi:hypothetical protein
MAMISTDAVTSGARLTLVYGLQSDTSWGTEVDRDIHPDAPEMRKLKQALSAWVPVAGHEKIPSLLVYTLEEKYALDLAQHPKFKNNDATRIRAVQAATSELDLNIYYTVTASNVIATYDLSKDEKPRNGESFVEFRTLETHTPLHGKSDERSTWECVSISKENILGEDSSFSIGVDESEMLQFDEYDDLGSEKIYKMYHFCYPDEPLYYHP